MSENILENLITFVDSNHVTNFQELMLKDCTYKQDVERQALFFLLASLDSLFSKVRYLYDFGEHSIKPESLEDGSVDLTGGERALVLLAFNLYNSFPAPSVIDIFASLDEHRRMAALEAIKIRFRMENY